MKAFEHPNYCNGFICPICKTGADAPVVLVPTKRVYSDENLHEFEQIHEACYNLVIKMQREEAL